MGGSWANSSFDTGLAAGEHPASMKKWALSILAVILVLAVAAGLYVYVNLNSLVKRGVETVGPKLTKVEVRLASANLSPLNGNGELNTLFVGNPEGYKEPAAIEIGKIKVALKLSTAFSDTIVIDKIDLESPEITFEGGLGGNNLSQILKNLDGAPDDVQAKDQSSGEEGRKYFIKEVFINGGKIHARITGLGANSLTVPLPPIHLQNIGSENKGVTAAQLAKEILKPLIVSATKAGLEAVAGGTTNLRDLGKDAAEQLNKKASGLKDLFKK